MDSIPGHIPLVAPQPKSPKERDQPIIGIRFLFGLLPTASWGRLLRTLQIDWDHSGRGEICCVRQSPKAPGSHWAYQVPLIGRL
jgi:hypothetical protein